MKQNNLFFKEAESLDTLMNHYQQILLPFIVLGSLKQHSNILEIVFRFESFLFSMYLAQQEIDSVLHFKPNGCFSRLLPYLFT